MHVSGCVTGVACILSSLPSSLFCQVGLLELTWTQAVVFVLLQRNKDKKEFRMMSSAPGYSTMD